MKLLVLILALSLSACATMTAQAPAPEPIPPIVEPEPTTGSLVVTLSDYAECFVEKAADAMQGRLALGPCL